VDLRLVSFTPPLKIFYIKRQTVFVKPSTELKLKEIKSLRGLENGLRLLLKNMNGVAFFLSFLATQKRK